MNFTRAWLVDSLERLARAFLIAFCGGLILSGADVFSLSAVHAAALAGVASCLSVVLSVLGASVPGGVSPASLVARRRTSEAGYGLVELLIAVLLIIVILWVLLSLVGR